jgi:hypothetical protein
MGVINFKFCILPSDVGFIFLILDVSRNKYPPVWVKAEQLWQAMATTDAESGKTRGLVLVSR